MLGPSFPILTGGSKQNSPNFDGNIHENHDQGNNEARGCYIMEELLATCAGCINQLTDDRVTLRHECLISLTYQN